jgi:hypothetical protein
MEKVLLKMPVQSNTFLPGGPIIRVELGRTSVLCEYEDAVSGNPFRLTLIFEKVEVSKLTHYLAIDVEIIDRAYEQVVDLGETEWLQHVRSNLIQNRVDPSDLRHLVVYFDGGPGLEFICREFKTTSERILLQ